MSFVLRFEIDNVRSITNKTADSEVFHEQGFEWKAIMRPRQSDSNYADWSLTCDNPNWADWKCEADVEMVLPSIASNLTWRKTFHWKFNEGQRDQTSEECTSVWNVLIDPAYGFTYNNKITIEFHFKNFQSECDNAIDESTAIVDLEKFSSPNESGNVTLVMGEKKVTVSKEFLAVHSPVFAAMFHKNYAEKGKDEVEIKDVVHEEFIDLLQMIFPVPAKITDSTVLHVLALGDRFQMQQVVVFAEAHLQTTKKFSVAEKLRFSDAYRLEKLRESCLKTYSTVQQIGTLESAPDYANYSDKMKAAICDRVMKLVKDKAMN